MLEGFFIHFPFELVDNDLVLEFVLLVVPFAADSLVLGGAQVGGEFVYFFEREFLGDVHLVFLLSPLLVVQLDDPQVLELQLLLLALVALMVLALLVLLVGLEVVLFLLCEGILLPRLYFYFFRLVQEFLQLLYLLESGLAELEEVLFL